MKYGLIISNNHYIAEIEGKRYIIDTGSPISFSKGGGMVFAGKRRFALPLWMLSKESAIVSLVGMAVDGLIGTNLLLKHSVTFDKKNMSVIIDENVISTRGTLGMGMLKVPFFVGYPSIWIELNGKKIKALFDTGACISYASNAVIAGTPCTGKANDYSPNFGHFETELHESSFSSKTFTGRVLLGSLPRTIWYVLKPFGFEAVLGMDLFYQFDCINLDFEKRRIHFGSVADKVSDDNTKRRTQ